MSLIIDIETFKKVLIFPTIYSEYTSSVASFWVLEGGGGQDPQMYRQKKKIMFK